MSKKKLIVLDNIVGASSLLMFFAVNLEPNNSTKMGSASQEEATKFAIENKKLVARLNHKVTNKPLLPKNGPIKKEKLATIIGKQILDFDKNTKYSFKVKCDEHKGIAHIEAKIIKKHKKIITILKLKALKHLMK